MKKYKKYVVRKITRNTNYNETGHSETNSERSDREKREYDYEDESMKRFIYNSDEYYKSLTNINAGASEEEWIKLF